MIRILRKLGPYEKDPASLFVSFGPGKLVSKSLIQKIQKDHLNAAVFNLQ